MYRLDLNFADAYGRTDNQGDIDSDCESDTHSSDAGDTPSWNRLECRLLQRIVSFLPRQSDRRNFCMVSKDWALAAEPSLWAYPEFSTPQQLSSFLHVVSGNSGARGRYVRGIRFTLASHYDRHLTSPYYSSCDQYTDAELPTLRELVQGKHVLSADPALMRPLLHGSDLTSPPLAFRFARMCSPIDSLSVYGFRLRDKHVVNDLMRWNLRELEIIGMPRKPLANLGFLLHSLRSLRSLRIESDQPLPADIWSPLSLRMPALHKLRIWAPGIIGSQLLRASDQQLPRNMVVLHLVGPDNDVGDELVERVVQGSPGLQSLAVHGANITARSATAALGNCVELTYLELARYSAEEVSIDGPAPVVVSSRLSTLTLRNVAVHDSLVRSAASVVTRLRTLHIAGSNCLAGTPVADLLRSSTCLVALGLYSCPLLSDHALQGLAESPSAPIVRVVIVENCAMQSDGVERVLTAFPHVEHFTVIGTEMLRQEFTFAFNAREDAASPDDKGGEAAGRGDETNAASSKPLPVKRSFNLVYPPDHFLCEQSRCPQVEGRQEDPAPVPRSAADLLAPRQSWNDAAPRYFVPGLLAFAGAAEDISRDSAAEASTGRRRAATLYTDDQSVPDTQMQPRGGRLRSISELPSGTDIMASRFDTESAPHSPPEHAVLPNNDGTDAIVEESGAALDDADIESVALVDEDADVAVAETGADVGNDDTAAHPPPLIVEDSEPTFRSLPVEDSATVAEVESQKRSGGFATAAAAVALATAGYIFGTSDSAKDLSADTAPDVLDDDDADKSLDGQPETAIAQDIAVAMSEDISISAVDDNEPSPHQETAAAEFVSSADEPTAGDSVARSPDVEEPAAPAPSEESSPVPDFTPSDELATEFHSADECVASGSPATCEPRSCDMTVDTPTARSLSAGGLIDPALIAGEPVSEQLVVDAEAFVEVPEAVSELADVDSAVTDVKVDAQLPDTVDEPAVSEAAEENKADLTIAAAGTPIPEEAPVDSAIPDGTGAEVFVSEVLPASVEPSAEQPDADSGVVEDNKPGVSDVATTEIIVAESANPESFADEPSVEIADDSATDTKEQAVEQDVPVSSLAVDDSSPATPAAQEHLADDNEPSTETRSVEMPAATDPAEASAAVEETSESAATKKDIQESEVAVDSAPGVEETAAEHISATGEPTVIAEQVVIDQTAEDSSEAPAAEEISEAGAVEKEVDFQQAADAETAADESSEPAATDPVSDQAQIVDQPSEQPPVEAASELEEQAVDPCSVDEVAAPDATPVSVPSISDPSVADQSVAPVVVGNDTDAPATASDEPVVSAAVDVPADEEFQEDTAEPALDVSEPSADAQSNEEPVAEEVAVEEKDDAPAAIDEKLDTNPGEVSVETESAVKEKASETEEVPASSSIEDGPEPETTDDASSASVHMPVVDTPEDIPTSDSQTVEQTVPDEPVADESSTSAVPDEPVADEYPIAAIPDEVAPSAPAVDESAESSAQDVSERSIGEEVLVVEKAACAPDVEERTAEPPSEEEAAAPEPEAVVAPVVEEELAASTSVDDAVPSSQGTVEPSDGAPEPTDVEIPVGDEVIPEDAITTESSQPELAIEEQNDIVVESLDNVDSTKEIAEPESAADDMFEEQPTTSTGHVDSSDADAVEADRPIPRESNVVVDTPVAEIPAESAALLNDAPVLDVSEESETPAELSDATEHMAATDSIPVPATDVVADELAEPSVDSRDVEASVPTPDLEEQAPSAPDVEESAVEPVGVVASAEAEKPTDIADDQPSDEAAETSIDESPADAPAAEQTVSADHTADEQVPLDSMVQEESLLPAAEEAPAPSADDVSQEEDVSERLESDDPATENDTPLPGSNDEAVLVKDALTVEEPSATEFVVEEPVSEAQAAESADADQTPPPTTDSDVVAVDDKPSVDDSVPMTDIQPATASDSKPNADDDALVAEESVPEQVEREDLVSECATRDTEPATAVDNELAPVSDEAVVADMAVDETIVEVSASLPTVEEDTTAVVEEFDAQEPGAEEPGAEEPAAEEPVAEDPINAPPAVEETVSLSDTEEDAVPNAAEESVALEEITEVPIPEEPAAKVESAAETVHLSNADIPAIEGQASAELVGDSARSLDDISVALTTDEPVEVPVIAELAETPEPESVEPVFESLQAAEPTTAVPIAEKVETPEPAIEEPVAEEPAVEEMAETPELVSVEPVLESLQAAEPTTTVSTTDEVEAPVLATEDPVVEEPAVEDPTASPAAKGDALPAEPANEEPLPDIAAPSVGSESNVPVEVEEPEGAEAKGPANIDSEPNMVVVPDASTADDDTTPVAEEPEFAVPTVEEPIPSDALQTLDEPAIASVVEGEKIEAPVATSIEPGEIVPDNETPTSAEAADSQTPPAVDADAPISVDMVDSLAEDASPAIQEESGVVEELEADANDFVIVDDSTNVSELSDREPITDTLEAAPVVSLETEEEPEPAAAIADDNIAAAPEPDLVEPPVVDGDDADREIPLEEPVAGASESANESIDEPADPPAATEESALSGPVVGDFELAPVSEHDSDSNADAVKDAAPENLPDVDDSQNAQDPVGEEALPMVIDSSTEDQDVESAPAADLLAPESTPVEAQAAEDEVTEDKLVDSEDLDTDSPDADVVIVSGDPIRDEPAAIVEPVNVSVAETDAPEPPSETQALDDVAASSSPLREPVSREIGTDAVNIETPVLEEPADVSAPGDAPEHVDTAIAISNAEPVDPASSANSEQRKDLEVSSGLEPVAEQQLIEEVEVASAPRDLDVVEGSEDKPATEEASTLSDYVTVSVEEPVFVAAAAASEAANVAAPVDDALSTGQTTAEPVSEEPAVAERSIDEEIGAVDVPPASTTDTEEAAAKEPVEIASIAPEDAFAEPSSEGLVDDTPVTDEAAPNTAVAEDTVPVQSSSADVAEQVRVPGTTEDAVNEDAAISFKHVASDDIETADTQEPTAVDNVARQPLDSSVGITADAELETDMARDLHNTVIDEPSLLSSPDAEMAGIAAGVALASVAAGIGLTQHADSVDAQASSADKDAVAGAGHDGNDDDEGVIDDVSKEAKESEVAPLSAVAPGEPADAETPTSETSALDSELEMIEYEGSNISPTSPYELVDPDGSSDAERPVTGGASPLVPADLSGRYSPPVVVGTIEEVRQPAQELSPINVGIPSRDELVDISGHDQTDSQMPASVETGESEQKQTVSERSLQETSPDAALAQQRSLAITPDVAAWSSPQSQMSYNRTDSQLSISPPTHTPTSADDEHARSLSKRDSAIYMDKSIKEASLTTDEAEAAVESQGAEDDQAVLGGMPVQGPDTAPVVPETPPYAYSAYSTPAFPQYFSHTGASREQQQQQQQQQEVGTSIPRRGVPRASSAGKRPSKSTRPKDVLMELNIETPYNGRQLMQLHITDDLDEMCEKFCTEHKMIDLLPGMKSLVRGKIERRLARRQERALQTAAANAREKHAI